MPEMTISNFDLLQLQAETLFTHSPAGRIIENNRPMGGPAARLFLGRTREGNLWRIRDDVPEDVAQRLEELAAAEPVRDDLEAPPVHLDAMLEALQGDPAPEVMDTGPAYRFPGEVAEPTGIIRITRANLDLLRPMVPDWDDLERDFERGEPSLAIVVDGAAVSTSFTSFQSARAMEVGVSTREEWRGRGYAPALVAAWARAVRESGRIPLYSTDWDNLASRAVARKLHMVMYGSDLSIS
jgi:hypothetical protein